MIRFRIFYQRNRHSLIQLLIRCAMPIILSYNVQRISEGKHLFTLNKYLLPLFFPPNSPENVYAGQHIHNCSKDSHNCIH